MTLRIGAHPNNLSLTLFAARQGSGDNGDIDVFSYGSGTQTIPLLRVGAIHLGGTGSTPPLHAQAAGMDVAVVATTAPRGDHGGIAVRADGPIRTLADLAGRGIATMPLSWHPQYLARVLTGAGLRWDSVTVVELATPTAHDALVAGRLDAWVATGPDLERLQSACDVRILAPVTDHFANRSVLWTRHGVLAERAESLADTLARIDASDRRAADDPAEAARVLAEHGPGHDTATWERLVRSRRWGLLPPDHEFVDEQQRDADLLSANGVLHRPVDVGASLPTRPLLPDVAPTATV
ncbi:ABC transporter substrate-binding protein [Spiractinospora alimapuensis]|uniref:ABC transporter substrate-binding protein n=1 Tax=Spiractinospora alimapuensis TaxID=2820884 RepID=UPI001F4274B4|nr:ABC transporter substrate-binding protein [Spiractinospora alimapuensis]QVQ52760.1 ABC transporter substrate-binding protein [Spiractinospora alimapuensis]